MFPVYLITCHHPSYGRYIMPYVGVVLKEGKTIEQRFAEHYTTNGHVSYLTNAIKKYGREHFRIEQIDAGNTPEHAFELERWWIARLGTRAPNGYNLTAGGEGVVNPTEEVRQAIINHCRKVAHLGGRKNAETGHIQTLASSGGRAAAARALESGRIFTIATPESCAKGGRIAGRKNAEKNGYLAKIACIAGRKAVESGHIQRLKESGVLARNFARGRHTRWHVKRNIINPVCPFCQKVHYPNIKQT